MYCMCGQDEMSSASEFPPGLAEQHAAIETWRTNSAEWTLGNHDVNGTNDLSILCLACLLNHLHTFAGLVYQQAFRHVLEDGPILLDGTECLTFAVEPGKPWRVAMLTQ